MLSVFRWLRLMPHARVDRDHPQRCAADWIASLQAGDFSACEASLAAVSSSARRDCLLDWASLHARSTALAEAWTAACPQSAWAWVLRGRCVLQAGWRIRGYEYAADVSRARLRRFGEHLQQAASVFERALSIEPMRAEAYAGLISCGMASDVELEQLQHWMQKGLQADPWNFACLDQFHKATTQKWAGSHEVMLDFVQWIHAGAPRGDAAHLLVAEAYCELAMAELDAVKHRYGRLRQRMEQSAYRAQVVDALYAWLDADAQSLPQRLAMVEDSVGRYGLNQFALALYFTGAREQACAVIEALRGRIQELPWAWFPFLQRDARRPGFVHDRICRDLGLRPANVCGR